MSDRLIIGTDEAGRGSLAFSIVAAAVFLPENHGIEGIRDSKKLSPKKREELFEELTFKVPYHWAQVDHTLVDSLNPLGASLLAMRWAVEGLIPRLDFFTDLIIVDGPYTIPGIAIKQQAVPKADDKYPCVSAASIVAKVTRDRMMIELSKDPKYAVYKWDENKGYGTRAHREAIQKFGPCEIHRRTFRGVL